MVLTRSRHPAVIWRPRLLRLLDGERPAAITLVTAPAGYGKSTLIEQWARSSPHVVARVSLGTDANSLPIFLALISAALDRAQETAERPPDPGLTLDAIVDRLAAIEGSRPKLALVIDDYHLIENPDVHQAMDVLIAGLSPAVRLLLVSRAQPPLTLGRLRLTGELREITVADLGFTPAETASVMPMSLSTRLSEHQMSQLVARTGGWIAGIRLALAVLDERDDDAVDQVLAELAYSPWLDDYLVEEVLDRLPADVHDFVMRSVALPWLEPELCDTALAMQDAARLMREVERRVLFVKPGPDAGTLTYHDLFAECVQRIAARHLDRSTRQSVHRRAAGWFECAGKLDHALDQAVAAEAWDDAVRYARALCQDLMDRDYHHSRLHLLRRLPESLVLATPYLARGYISALQYTGHLREARQAFTEVEPGWAASGDPTVRGYLASCRALFAISEGNSELTLRLCYEALHHYPLEDAVERLHAWVGIIQAEFLRGNDDVVHHAYRQAEHCRERLPAEQAWWTLVVEPDRANHLALRGDLANAESMLRESAGRLPVISRGHEPKIRARLAAIYLEWNDLDRAAAECERVERGLDDAPYYLWHLEALLVVARVAGALGQAERVDALLRRVRDMIDIHGGRNHHDRCAAEQALVWLREGNMGLAREWAATARMQEFSPVRTFGDPDPRLALAMVDLADGAHQVARDRLQRLTDHAIGAKRWAELVPLAVWHVVACLALDHEAAALESLRLALRHGREGGFVRSFLTPGYDIGPFLHRARVHLGEPEAAWLQHLLDQGVWRMPVSGPPVREPATPGHSLSHREVEVLRLLQLGLPNRAIATELFVSEHTVKKHVRAILSKLGATNRTNAVVIARDRGLLA